MAKIYEPVGATDAEIAAMNQRTQKLVSFQGGMADGSIVTLSQIVDKSEDEIMDWDLNEAKQRVVAGTQTEDDYKLINAIYQLKAIK